MIILYFDAKEYDHIWFGKYANDCGFDVYFIEAPFNPKESYVNNSVICIPDRQQFTSEELECFKNMNLQAILLRVKSENYDDRRGMLGDIPVFKVLEYSPRLLA